MDGCSRKGKTDGGNENEQMITVKQTIKDMQQQIDSMKKEVNELKDNRESNNPWAMVAQMKDGLTGRVEGEGKSCVGSRRPRKGERWGGVNGNGDETTDGMKWSPTGFKHNMHLKEIKGKVA